MAIDPLTIIGEILGEPAAEMREPVTLEYRCPYINSICIKRSQRSTAPMPVCSIYRNAKRPDVSQLVCVCPKRFFEASIDRDVIDQCWTGPKPRKTRIAYEVKMSGFGQVDMVIASVNDDETVKDFLSVELQAVDITGSYEPAYEATVNSKMLDAKPTYNFNWANVRKRYLTQLIAKGFYHHHWKTRIVAILQDHVYEEIRKQANFDELATAKSHIVFLIYKFERDGNDRPHFVLSEVVGTSHTSLMNGVLYRDPPLREDFCKRIQKQFAKP